MTKPKPSLYDQFRERILTDLNKGVSCVFREKYVDWGEVSYTVKTPIGKTWVLKSGKKYTRTITTRHYLTKWRNEQLRVLHKVMNDLVREGFLYRSDRAKPRVRSCNRHIFWYSRLKQDEAEE